MIKRTHAIALASASLAAVGTAGISGVLAAGADDQGATTTEQAAPSRGESPNGGPGPGFGRGHGGPGHHGGRGPGGPGPRITEASLSAIADKLGVTAAQLKSALEAARPERPGDDEGMRGRGHRGPFDIDSLAKELGVEASAIENILEANRPKRPSTPPAQGTKPPKPDLSGLISALAKGLNKDEATVKAAFDKLKAAHEAEHAARETARFEAIGKELNKPAADVKAAFESVLGTKATAAAKKKAAAKAAAKKRAAARKTK